MDPLAINGITTFKFLHEEGLKRTTQQTKGLRANRPVKSGSSKKGRVMIHAGGGR